MKRIDLVTVLISSGTLLLFCLCSYLLLWRYSIMQDSVHDRTSAEIVSIADSIEQLDGLGELNGTRRVALADQLESNIRVLKRHQNEWVLLRQTLNSFVAILIVIVFSHLFFVYTLIKPSTTKQTGESK